LLKKREYKGKNIFNKTDESEMVLIGLVGFLDPPKKDVKDTLNQLYSVGVKTKILTGDNYYATQNICSLVGLNAKEILTGNDIEKLTDKELSKKIENVDVFARLNPLQKERIVGLYMKNGHVVGYMGDGVNDAPSLHQADIGISVNSATDIAKETSDMILLERSLNVIYDGIIEGRKVYGNIIKYMKMALSGDYGDVFSIMIASIFLPFLPLLPIQMLFQDFIYDFSQIGIPYDSVDQEFLKYPHKWNTGNLSDFMQAMGMVSSIFDVISFIIFWFVLGYNTIDKQAYFQTAWFVTCLITELMIIINVRTAKKPFIESNPSKQLLLLTLFSCVLTIITPILFKNISTFNFVVLPLEFYLFLVIVVLLYFITVTVIKKFYIKKYKEWL
jgi:Mg2+-importing ATPase